jgi:Arc/MetJ-type ribon-helix-helix transcriptional regulator
MLLIKPPLKDQTKKLTLARHNLDNAKNQQQKVTKNINLCGWNCWMSRKSFGNKAIDRRYKWRYVSSMKIKTSITLSDEILKAIDLHIGAYRSRSEFLETAARFFIEQLKKKEAEQRDLEIINKNADTLNGEADDVLGYQIPI